MNALADAAFMTAPEAGQQGYQSAAYTDGELRAMGVGIPGLPPGLPPGIPSNSMLPPLNPQVMSQAMPLPPGARSMVPAPQLPGPGRHLQILDHTVHRIDAHTKANGEEEKEMVVSNLRHFTLKIGVLDPRMGMGRDSELPLKAELLYENGQLVEQLATCEPLLVGKTEVLALQGTALFKLRITSLSSHRDKQRFRIRVSPVDTNLLLREPGLSVVTTPMKCVTKLSHRISTTTVDGEGEGEEWEEGEGGGGGAGAAGGSSNNKRKRDDIEPILESHGQQLQQLQRTNIEILEQLQALKQLLQQRTPF